MSRTQDGLPRQAHSTFNFCNDMAVAQLQLVLRHEVTVHLRMSMKGAHSQGSNDQLAASGLGVCGSGLYFRLVGAGLPRPLSGGLVLPAFAFLAGLSSGVVLCLYFLRDTLLPSATTSRLLFLRLRCLCLGLAGLSASEGVFA